MSTSRIIDKFNSAACYGYHIAQLLEKRERCMRDARNARYSKGPGWLSELPYNVMMARQYNHELVGQLKQLRPHVRRTNQLPEP